MSKDYPCVYWNDGKCKKFSDDNITSWCVWGPCDSQTPSNADRIRAMNDEELATHLHDNGWDCHLCAEHGRLDNEPLLLGEKCDEKCVEHCLEWLQQPAEEVDNETVGERKDGDD